MFKRHSNRILTQALDRLRNGWFEHVAFLCGAGISRPAPTLCPAADDVRTLVLEHFRQEAGRFAECPLSRHISDFLEKLPPTLRFGEERQLNTTLAQHLSHLPFEQFMGCLEAEPGSDDSHSNVALALAQSLFDTTRIGEPNAYHHCVADSAIQLLKQRLARRVTVITTNYEQSIETAFKSRNADVSLRASPYWIAEGAPTFDVVVDSEYAPGMGRAHTPLTLVKVHGCVTCPSTMVLSFRLIAQRLVKRTYFSRLADLLADADLLLMLGYSLSDYDLRPVIRDGLRRGHGLAIWTEWRGAAHTSGDTRGSQTARDAVLRDGRILTHFHDLYTRDSDNLLCILSAALGLEPVSVPCYEALPSTVGARVSACLPTLDSAAGQYDTALFCGRLADACCTGDAAELLGSYVPAPAGHQTALEAASGYLQAMGHERRYEEALQTARRLRSRHESPSVQIRAASYELFVCALSKDTTGALRAWLSAMVLRVWYRRHVADEVSVRLFNEASVLWSRGGVIIGQRLRSATNRVGRVAGWLAERVVGHYLMIRYRQMERKSHQVGDLALVTGCKDIYAQSLLMAGRVSRAREIADDVQELYEQLQYFNGIGLGERTRSWVALAMGDVAEARRRLARSVMVGAYSADTSLLPKFVVSLLRVAAAEASLGSGSQFMPSVADSVPGVEHVEEAARWLHAAGPLSRDDGQVARRLSVLGSWACHAYSQPDAVSYIKRELDRYRDVTRFPIFLITDPKRGE